MSDEAKPQTQIPPKPQEKKEDKKPPNGPGQGGQSGNRNRRNPSRSGNPNNGNSGGPRPASRGSNKRGPVSSTNPTESGSDSAAKRNDGKKNDHRSRPSTGGPRSGGNRRPSQSANQAVRQNSNNSNNNGSKQNGKQPASASPAPIATSDSSDALSSLQRVIADLKTTSPPAPQPSNSAPGITASMSMPSTQTHGSNLPPNAPVFQPGAAAYPGIAGNEPPRHRKAASLGTGQGPAIGTYSPNLGSMMEDVEEQVNASVEEGEIRENNNNPAGHQRRSLSQSFTAPRFAALAAAQSEQSDMNSAGRPQLAPGFMFGGRRRPSAAMPLGPPINEEDLGFQFPQQQSQPNFSIDSESGHRKPDQGEINGIMAEQVSRMYSAHAIAY